MRHKVACLSLATIALTGCVTTRTVAVHCLTAEQYAQLQKAEPPKVADKLTGHADEDTRTLAGSAIRLRSWGEGMLGVLSGCQGD